jgi:hypothetical protein
MNFHAKHVTGARSVSPQTLIQLAYDECCGDSEKSVGAVIAAAAHNRALSSYLVAKGAAAVIGELRRNDNNRIFKGNDNAAPVRRPLRMIEQPLAAPEAVRRRAVVASSGTLMLLSIVLPNGVRMANAKRADVDHAARTYEGQANDMTTKALYYKAVLARLPEGKEVGEVFTDEVLTGIMNDAKIPA